MNKTELKDRITKYTAALKKGAAVVLNKIKKIKPADAAVTAGIVIISGIIIIPSIVQCVENREKASCIEHMYRMRTALSEELAKEAETGGTYWQSMITNGNYRKLLSALTNKTIDKEGHPASDYYIRVTGDKLELICKKHRDISIGELILSSIENVSIDFGDRPIVSDDIFYINVSGPDTYYRNESLDPADPEKMIFEGSELDDIINNLTVTAVYKGGYSAELGRNEYTITSDRLDMTKSGQTRLVIKTNSNSVWDGSAYDSFFIDVIGAEDIPPLIVDAGINGKYELAAWDWKDFVAEAAQEEEGKTFGASIIRVGDKYYYYPDGLRIINSEPNTTPFEYAFDTDGSGNPAYNILFDTNSVILNSSDGDKIHNGSVRAEAGRVYIWQDEPSKELNRGWIIVYCDLKRY